MHTGPCLAGVRTFCFGHGERDDLCTTKATESRCTRGLLARGACYWVLAIEMERTVSTVVDVDEDLHVGVLACRRSERQDCRVSDQGVRYRGDWVGASCWASCVYNFTLFPRLHDVQAHITTLLPALIMKSLILVSALAALTSALPANPLDRRAPPNVPSTSSANSLLAGLTVAAQGPQTGYSRDLFPHWITQSGTCNTRETVLKRDGTNVVTDSACASTSGSWFSPYDGATWTAASDVDIDHMVPLSNAWKVRLS